jgi:hypothetical protein
MTSFLDTINAIEDLPTGDLAPGVIWWLHGAKAGQTKAPGVWYAKATEFSDIPGAPWESDSRFDGEAGFSTPTLRIAPIGWRAQWFMQDKNDPKALPRYIPDYEAGANKHVEILAMIEGQTEVFIISVKGFHKTKAMLDAIRTYENGLLKQASRLAKRALPRWTFWLPIKNKLNNKGETDYIEAQDGAGKAYGSVVTPPALYLPDDAMESCFVGESTLRRGADIRAQYDQWFKQKRLPPQIAEGVYHIEEVKQLSAGRNVPQPVEEGDLF